MRRMIKGKKITAICLAGMMVFSLMLEPATPAFAKDRDGEENSYQVNEVENLSEVFSKDLNETTGVDETSQTETEEQPTETEEIETGETNSLETGADETKDLSSETESETIETDASTEETDETDETEMTDFPNGKTEQNKEWEQQDIFMEDLSEGVSIAPYITVQNGVIMKYSETSIKNIVIPEKVNGVTITGIGSGVFQNHTEITSVTFPKTLKSIGNYAFQGASLGTGSELGKIVIPSSVTNIGYNAFRGCTYLGSVEFEDAEAAVKNGIYFEERYGNDGYVFADCSYLEKIKLSNQIVTIPCGFMDNCTRLQTVVWGSQVRYIHNQAFYKCGNLKKIDLSGTCVETIGSDAFNGCKSAEKVLFPNTLKTIGAYAFYAAGIGTNTQLGTLRIPSCVKEIGYNAFANCGYLESVYFEDALSVSLSGITFDERYGYDGKVFEGCPYLSEIRLSNQIVTIPYGFALNCKKLEKVIFGSNVKSIHAYAFSGCISLKEINLSGTKLESIDANAFTDCKAAEKVVFPNTLKVIGAYSFQNVAIGSNTALGTLVIPKSVSSIYYNAFENCQYLGKVEFQDVDKPTVEGIHFDEKYGYDGAVFQACPNLSQIKLSNEVVTIPCMFAKNCKKLQTVIWGANVKYIHTEAFFNCISLNQIDLSNTKTQVISDNAFQSCISVEKVVFPATLEKIGCNSFQNAAIGSATGMGTLTIPKSVTFIGMEAFQNCTYLGTVLFEDVDKPTVDGICFDERYGYDGYVFKDCSNLAKIRLSNNIITIPNGFAKNCKKLKSVEWGKNVTNLHSAAFSGCESLKSVDLSATKVKSIGSDAFLGCTGIEKVVFPSSVKEIGYEAFMNASIGTGSQSGTLVIPSSIESIGDKAFYNCKNLGNVVFENVKTPTVNGVNMTNQYYSYGVFAYCKELKSIRISNNVKRIPARFAYGCTKLVSISFGSSDLTIDSNAFYVSLNRDQYLPTVVDGSAPAIQAYDWKADHRTLTAKYTIVFHSNTKTDQTITQVVPRNQNATLMSNPFTYEGHVFAVWNTVANGTGQSYANSANIKNLADANGTIHLYAQWKTKTFKVTLYGNGGKWGQTAQKTVVVTYGKTYADIMKSLPTNPGQQFDGWYTDSVGGKSCDWTKKVVGSEPYCELYAHWSEICYQVVFNANTTQTFSIGQVTTGMGKQIAPKAGKIYDAKGNAVGTINSPYFGLAIEYGESIALNGNEYSVKGYSIKNWNTKADGTGTSYPNSVIMPLSTKNMELYAQWKLNKYKIRYDLDGGTNDSQNPKFYTVCSNDIVLKAPVKKGYQFVGFKDQNGKVITKIQKGSTGEMNLTAVWKENTYQIVFHGGKYTKATSEYTQKGVRYSQVVDLIDAAKKFPTAEPYTNSKSIIAWSTKENGKGTRYHLKNSCQKLTAKNDAIIHLYAVWGGISYQIRYELDGGENPKQNPLYYTCANKAVTFADPVRKGYQFTGWIAEGSAKKYFREKKLLSNALGSLLLKATWKPIGFTVKLLPNNSYATKKQGIVEQFAVTYDQPKLVTGKGLYENPYFDLIGYNTKANGSGTSVLIGADGKIKLGNLTTKNGATVKLYAQWKVHTYQIQYVNLHPTKKYDANNAYDTQLRGVVNPNPTTYDPTQSVSFLKPTCSGYLFEGYYSDENCTRKVKMIPKNYTGNYKLYAKWKKK